MQHYHVSLILLNIYITYPWYFFVAIELIMNSPGAVNGFWSVMMDGGAGMMNVEKST